MTGQSFSPFDPDVALLEEGADEVLLGLLARDNEPPPVHAPYRQRNHETAPSPGFDKAAFRRHMQDVIARREAAARDVFARERDELDRIIGHTAPQLEFDADQAAPPPKPSVVNPQPWPTPPGATIVWPQQNVEPWFNPTRPPTPEDMRCIAQYALNYFTAAHGLVHAGWPPAQPAKQMAHAVCARDADAIAHALMRWVREIPKSARFSAYPLPVPDGVLAATITSPYLSLQVASVEDGQKVSMVIMFDEPEDA